MNIVRVVVFSVVVLGMALGVGACGDQEVADKVAEGVGDAAEQAVGTAGAEVSGTVGAKVTETGATVEAKAEEVGATLESAVEQVDDVVADLKGVYEKLDGWAEEVVAAVGIVSDQATALRSDPSLMADSEWRSETEAAVKTLAQRAEDATTIATDLEESGKLPAVGETLDTLGYSVGEAAAELEEHLLNDDALAFLKSTEELERVKLGLDMLLALIETARK